MEKDFLQSIVILVKTEENEVLYFD